MTRLSKDFGVVANEVARDPSISVGAKALYLLLTTYSDGAGLLWPSNGLLAKQLGVSRSTLIRSMNELVKRGVVVRMARVDKGSQTSSMTVLTERAGGVTGETCNGVTGDTQNKTTRTTPPAPSHVLHPKKVRAS